MKKLESEENNANHLQPCPVCGQAMKSRQGSKESICAGCGYKESCCY